MSQVSYGILFGHKFEKVPRKVHLVKLEYDPLEPDVKMSIVLCTDPFPLFEKILLFMHMLLEVLFDRWQEVGPEHVSFSQ